MEVGGFRRGGPPMTSDVFCPECEERLPADAPRGLSPACLLRAEGRGVSAIARATGLSRPTIDSILATMQEAS